MPNRIPATDIAAKAMLASLILPLIISSCLTIRYSNARTRFPVFLCRSEVDGGRAGIGDGARRVFGVGVGGYASVVQHRGVARTAVGRRPAVEPVIIGVAVDVSHTLTGAVRGWRVADASPARGAGAQP